MSHRKEFCYKGRGLVIKPSKPMNDAYEAALRGHFTSIEDMVISKVIQKDQLSVFMFYVVEGALASGALNSQEAAMHVLLSFKNAELREQFIQEADRRGILPYQLSLLTESIDILAKQGQFTYEQRCDFFKLGVRAGVSFESLSLQSRKIAAFSALEQNYLASSDDSLLRYSTPLSLAKKCLLAPSEEKLNTILEEALVDSKKRMESDNPFKNNPFRFNQKTGFIKVLEELAPATTPTSTPRSSNN